MGVYIKNMSKPKTCDDCIVPLSKCDYLQKRADDCPLIEIDENNPMLLKFLNEFDKWRAYKEVMNYIKSVYKEGEAKS